jgi:hypothetical protein
MSRLDEIRARHNRETSEGLDMKTHGTTAYLYAWEAAHLDRAYLLDLIDRIAGWISEKQTVQSIVKHGRLKAEHLYDAADELTELLKRDEP